MSDGYHDGQTESLCSPPNRFQPGAVIGLYNVGRARLYAFDDFRISGVAKRMIFVGRARNCDIQVADLAVSFVHCDITRGRNGSCTVRDASSRNGVWVNDLRISDATALRPGMWLTVGRTEFVAIGFDGPIPVLAIRETSFLARSARYHGSARRAAAHVGRSYSTIRRALQRFLGRGTR